MTSQARTGRARSYAALAIILCAVGLAVLASSFLGVTPGPPTPPPAAAGTIAPDAPAPRAATAQPSTGGAGGSAYALPSVSTAEPPATRRPPPRTDGPELPPSPPVSLSIPTLDVQSPVIQLGRNPDGSIEVPDLNDPDSKAGWYRNSSAPGTAGPSVIVGHVDSSEYGPGVFYRLGDLRPTDTIEVTRADGIVAAFRVDAVRSYRKDSFPTLSVYGNIDHAGLRLITCGGGFDASAGSYDSNLVAYATLISAHRPA